MPPDVCTIMKLGHTRPFSIRVQGRLHNYKPLSKFSEKKTRGKVLEKFMVDWISYFCISVISCFHDLRYFASSGVLWRLECSLSNSFFDRIPHRNSLGSSRRSPNSLVGWGYPLPPSHSLDDYGASFSAPAPWVRRETCSRDLGDRRLCKGV